MEFLHLNLPIGTAALILSHERPGEFITVHRKDNTEDVCLPGGKLDSNENIIEAVTRETFEETGITINPQIWLPIYNGVCEGKQHYWVSVFLTFVSGDVILNSSEPEMRPKWIKEKEFFEKTAFPLFNKEVFKILHLLDLQRK